MTREEEALKEIFNYIDNLPTPERPSDVTPKDCISDCYQAYDHCIAQAGSIAEKAVCKLKLQKCLEKC